MALPTTTSDRSEVMWAALVAFEGADAFRRKEIAHRRVDALIRTLHIVAALFQEGGQRCHRRAADANEMHLHSTAASSMISRLDSAGDEPGADAQRQSHSRAIHMASGKAKDDGAAKIRQRVRERASRRQQPLGSSHRGNVPSTIPRTCVNGPAQPQLREHAVEPVRPFCNVFEKQDRVVPWCEARKACPPRPPIASTCRPAAGLAPRRAVSRAGCRCQLAQRSRVGQRLR